MSDNGTIKIQSKDILSLKKRYSEENIRALLVDFPTENHETLARFLIARANNVTKAKDLLTAHYKWRTDNLPIRKSTCLNELKKGKLYTRGFDKDGHPLVIFLPRFNDPAVRDLEEMRRMAIWWAETIISQMPPEYTKATVLVDRTGNSSPDVQFVRMIAQQFQDNYPERLMRLIVYPGGLVFTGLWNIVRFLFDPITQEKVKPVLTWAGVSEYIDAQYIPESCGGTCQYEYDFAQLPDDPPYKNGEEHARVEKVPLSVFKK